MKVTRSNEASNYQLVVVVLVLLVLVLVAVVTTPPTMFRQASDGGTFFPDRCSGDEVYKVCREVSNGKGEASSAFRG